MISRRMFRTLLNAIRNGNPARIEQFIQENKKNTELTTEDGRELFKEAIVTTNYEIIQALIDGKILDTNSSPLEYIKPLNGRTIFGYAVFEKFDERALNLLATEGYDMLSYEECTDFVSNLVESYNPMDLTTFGSNLNKLRVMLSTCHKTSVQRALRNQLYNEPRISEVMNTVGWLKYHFKYGYGIISFKKVNKIYMEMGEGKWSDAVDTILSLDEDDINEKVYEAFPPEEDIPSWTLLSYAVSKSKSDVVNLLLSKSADVNGHSERIHEERLVKFTPFELAVEMNDLECCHILAENGANLYLQSSNPIGNILENAIRHGNIALVKLILGHRHYSDNDIQECLHEVVRQIHDANTKAQITECLKIYQIFGKTESTSAIKTMLLIQGGQEEEVLNLIKELPLDDLKDQISSGKGVKPGFSNLLTCATAHNKLEIVEALLEKGCNVDQTDGAAFPCTGLEAKSSLMLAIVRNNYHVCKLLLKWGASLKNVVSGESVFPYAFRQKNPKILRLLVERLHDPCSVFLEFAHFAMFSVSGEDVMNTFSMGLLSLILYRSRISLDIWLSLIRGKTIQYAFEDGVKRILLNLILNYLPSAPEEMQAALKILSESQNETEITYKDTDWLLKNAVKSSSLQHMCRFAIRQAVQPCSGGNIQSLELPLQIQEYILEHPLMKCLTNFQNEAERDMSVELDAKKSYPLYINH